MEKGCNLCDESKLDLGEKTPYGAKVIYKKDGWFATLSPKTGGNPEKDFTVQLMPMGHLNHISEISKSLNLAKSYGIAFSKISKAVTKIMELENRSSENDEGIIRVGTYGKSKHPEEHFHIKIFPWTGNIGQPYTVDSTFEHSRRYTDKDGEAFIKMKPVEKMMIKPERMQYLSDKLISFLK
jgi:hypothetical protein